MTSNLKLKYLLLLAFFTAYLRMGSAQESMVLRYDSLANTPTASLEDLSWIEGAWYGEAFGAKTEEVWVSAKGGSFMGMFKLYNDSEVLFYEIMIIRELEETLIMQLKHFNNDLVGWEEKEETIDFKLLKIKKNLIYFDGLTFEYVSEDRINVYVEIEESGQKEIVKFEYSSQKE